MDYSRNSSRNAAHSRSISTLVEGLRARLHFSGKHVDDGWQRRRFASSDRSTSPSHWSPKSLMSFWASPRIPTPAFLISYIRQVLFIWHIVMHEYSVSAQHLKYSHEHLASRRLYSPALLMSCITVPSFTSIRFCTLYTLVSNVCSVQSGAPIPLHCMSAAISGRVHQPLTVQPKDVHKDYKHLPRCLLLPSSSPALAMYRSQLAPLAHGYSGAWLQPNKFDPLRTAPFQGAKWLHIRREMRWRLGTCA